MKHRVLLLISMCVLQGALCAEEKPVSAALVTRMYEVPPNLFMDESGHLKEEIKAIVQPPSVVGPQYDLREFFKRHGCEFGAGEEAIFQQQNRTLLLRGKPETVDAAEGAILPSFCFIGSFLLRVEASLVEFSTAKVPVGELPSSFDGLRQAAGDSWRVVNRTVILTKSGQQTRTTAKYSDPREKPTASNSLHAEAGNTEAYHSLQPGEAGIFLAVEPVLGPDGRTIDLNVEYRYRAQARGGPQWEVTTSVTATDRQPIIVQVAPVAPEVTDAGPSLARALVLRAVVETPGPLKEHAERHPDSPAKP